VELGAIFDGKVTRLMGMGAFVEIMPGKEGLCHISHLSETTIRRPDDVVKVGDSLKVRVIEVDGQGRINLSAINLDQPFDPSTIKPREDRRSGGGGRGGDRDRGPRRDFGGNRDGGRDGGRSSDPDKGFRGHSGGSTPAPEEDDETPKARFRPRR